MLFVVFINILIFSLHNLHRKKQVLVRIFTIYLILILRISLNREDMYATIQYSEHCFQVKESMKNLEDVVKERNRAYWLLETGEDGERPGGRIIDELGWYL